MDNCPICQNELTELSELTGMSMYDLLYWCRNCGTVVYSGGNNASIYPTVLGQKSKHKPPRLTIEQILSEDGSSMDETPSGAICPEAWVSVRLVTDVSSY